MDWFERLVGSREDTRKMDVVIVSYGRPDEDFEALIERWS